MLGRRTLVSLTSAILIAGSAPWWWHRGPVVYAQTLPVTVHPQWSPNPVGENVVQYVVTLDGANPVTVLASACSPTLCTAAVVVNAFGAHVSNLVAQNLEIDSDPTTLQSSPPAILNWRLNQAPTKSNGLTVKP
jgi:hypothetical protein